MLAKKHYDKIAEILNKRYIIVWVDKSYDDSYKEAIEDTAFALADYFKVNNPRGFDRDKFLEVCGIE